MNMTNSVITVAENQPETDSKPPSTHKFARQWASLRTVNKAAIVAFILPAVDTLCAWLRVVQFAHRAKSKAVAAYGFG